LPEYSIAAFGEMGAQGQRQLMRTAVAPKSILPDSIVWHKAIGPFSYDNELSFMQEHKVDALVSKNSGGESTSAKLDVARALGIPVFMLSRPEIVPASKEFKDRNKCRAYVADWHKTNIEEE